MKWILLSFTLFTTQLSLANIDQKSEGWCSSKFVDINGPVKFVCNGVDPKVVKRLNELFDLKDKETKADNLNLSEKIQQANGWIKKYKWIAWVGLLAILVVAIDLIYTDLKILII